MGDGDGLALTPWAEAFGHELAAVDLLGTQAPTTLRQARRLARVVDRTPGIDPAMVDALVVEIDRLTRLEHLKLESWAGCAAMRRLRQRARAAPGCRAGIV